MAEYIEREATIELLRSLGSRDYRREKGTIQEAIKMVSFPEYTPSADVAPVRHGRWLCVDTDTEQFFLCNRCKKKEYWESNYCPNCGCLMDGGEQDA